MLQKEDNSKIIFHTDCTFKIAELIFAFPHRSFHIRELAKKTGYSTTAVVESLPHLQKAHLITVKQGPVTKNVQANIEAKEYNDYKRLFNLYRLTRWGIRERLILSFHNPECIVLFGSFAKGEDTEESDIDLLIITSTKEPRDSDLMRNYLKDLEKTLNRKINLHLLLSLEQSDAAFKNAVANGIVLHGYLKVI